MISSKVISPLDLTYQELGNILKLHLYKKLQRELIKKEEEDSHST
jgi:hypothetical protein